ncbi:MAG TPA: carbohydrate-binding domain-containing protein, partial [Prolixibacteraceae bacterium]|nr:carbohydrate-binding domain-containing protein [Prolixibacteraceae bacterium]
TISLSGGNLFVETQADDSKALGCDSVLCIAGGTIDLTLGGKASKGLKSDQAMNLSGGNITIQSTGGVLLEASGSGYDPSYSTAIKCDSDITIDGAQISIKLSGEAGRGISSDQNLIISGGSIQITSAGNGAKYTNTNGASDSYHSTCLTADGNIEINGGNVTTLSSGTAGRGITSGGSLVIGHSDQSPILSVTTSGSKITVSSGSNSGGWGGPGGGPGEDNGVYDESKAIKCDGAVSINNGQISISSADDGIKSLASVRITKGSLSITRAFEGIESPSITVQSGRVAITASDDGFNATWGNGGEANDGSILNLNGGEVCVNVSDGDGLDSNGNISMTGGTVVVHGPQSNPEVGMDYNGTCSVSGGVLIISGTNSNMTQAPGTSSLQCCIKATTSTRVAANTLFNLQDANGVNLVSFQPVRNYYSVIYSSPKLEKGASYSIYTGGTISGSGNNGYYSGGSYSGGTKKKTFTLSGTVTNVTF